MAKFITFTLLFTGIVSVLSLGKFKKIPVNNNKFNFEAQKTKHEQHLSTLGELNKAKNPKSEATDEKKPQKKEFVVVLDTPELERGHKLYGKCIACHGKMGEGKKSQKAPRVGGQMAWYLEKSLADMKSKARVNKVMDPYIKKLTQEDFRALAAYISKLPWSEED